MGERLGVTSLTVFTLIGVTTGTVLSCTLCNVILREFAVHSSLQIHLCFMFFH